MPIVLYLGTSLLIGCIWATFEEGTLKDKLFAVYYGGLLWPYLGICYLIGAVAHFLVEHR